MSITSVGKYTYGVQNINVRSWGEGYTVTIGNFCSFAENITVFTGGNHRVDRITTYPFGHIRKDVFTNFNGEGHPSSNGNVTIGNDVWIGTNVTIMSGITIGDGAVLAANSHVVKDVPPYSIVGGNPAKVIKYRFTTEQIDGLLKLKWWYWDDVKINSKLPLICSDRIDELLESS